MPGVRGIFAGKVGEYRGTRQLAHPDYELFDRDALELGSPSRPRGGPSSRSRFTPRLPRSRAGSFRKRSRLCSTRSARSKTRSRMPCAANANCCGIRRRLSSSTGPRSTPIGGSARDALRFQEAFVLQAALSSAAAREKQRESEAMPHRRLPARTVSMRRCRSRSRATSSPSVSRSRRPRHAGADEPAGAGRGRFRQDARRAAGDARCCRVRRPVSVARAHRGARGPAPAVDRAQRSGPISPPTCARPSSPASCPTAERRKALLATVSGRRRIVVGTHALLGDAVELRRSRARRRR